MQTSPPVTTAPDKVHRYPCPSCAADLLYEPRDGFLSCPYCGHKEAIPTSVEQVEERSFEQYLHIRPEQLSQLAVNALEVRCQSCGATVTFTPPEVARQCDFCGVQIVAQPKSADPILAPEGVLPFRLTQPQAVGELRHWLSSLWFAPSALKQFAQPDAIHGIYLPFWTYDTNTTSYYSGQRGEHYYVTETYYTTDSRGQQVAHTRQVQHTNWYSVSGTVSRWFDDVLVPGTVSLSQQRLHALEPWDLGELKPYDPAFLSGFKAQRYQVDLGQGFERVKEMVAGTIESDVRSDIGGDVQRIDDLATHYSGITFKHLLLPVYAGAYRFNGKVFQIVVNGRTGEIQGERPYSWLKIALLVLAILFVILVVLLVLGGTQ
jgi:DNA-directed RNA polymerase subunit RPC12/RpoP